MRCHRGRGPLGRSGNVLTFYSIQSWRQECHTGRASIQHRDTRSADASKQLPCTHAAPLIISPLHPRRPSLSGHTVQYLGMTKKLHADSGRLETRAKLSRTRYASSCPGCELREGWAGGRRTHTVRTRHDTRTRVVACVSRRTGGLP